MDNQQEQAKKDALARGVAFTRMIKEDGWKFVKMYFENRVKAFTTNVLIQEKPLVEFEKERDEIVGLRKLFSFIDSDVKLLENESKKDTGTSKV